jgi:uncharacterized protein (DUF1778 family)
VPIRDWELNLTLPMTKVRGFALQPRLLPLREADIESTQVFIVVGVPRRPLNSLYCKRGRHETVLPVQLGFRKDLVSRRFGKCFTAGPSPANRQHSVVKQRAQPRAELVERGTFELRRDGVDCNGPEYRVPSPLRDESPYIPMAEARGFTAILLRGKRPYNWEYAGSTTDTRASMAISTPEQRRDRRFQLRATAREETLIKVAAERQGVNVTDFIISAAREKAEETLADQTRFVLDDKQWKQFMRALDRPPREKPRLKKLFSESHVAERRS